MFVASAGVCDSRSASFRTLMGTHSLARVLSTLQPSGLRFSRPRWSREIVALSDCRRVLSRTTCHPAVRRRRFSKVDRRGRCSASVCQRQPACKKAKILTRSALQVNLTQAMHQVKELQQAKSHPCTLSLFTQRCCVTSKGPDATPTS